MAYARTSTKARSATDPTHGQSVPLARSPVAGQKRHLPPFWRHFLEMLAPVSVGMLATGAIFLSIVGSKTWDQVTVQYPPGPAGDGGRDDHPNGGLDALPGNGTPERPRDRGGNGPPPGPVLCLVWFDITRRAWCGAYCSTIVAMLVLVVMRYRRRYLLNGDVSRRQADAIPVRLPHERRA
jgi:hypothetical protein